jgi:uncharacterized membrane protein (DUF106 family)
MTRFKSIVRMFVMIFAVLAFSSYIIVTLGPIVALACGVIYSACQSGNTVYLLVSVWILPALIAIVSSPLMVDYMNLKREKKEREETDAEEMDADR